VAAVVVTLARPAGAVSLPTFDPSSSVVFSHKADVQNTSIAPVSQTIQPVPKDLPVGSFQLSHEFTTPGMGGLTSTTDVTGSIAEVTNALNTSIKFGAGTGVLQTNLPG
jgi:hypothetical protein